MATLQWEQSDHPLGTPTLNNVPASMYYHDALSNPFLMDTQEQKDDVHNFFGGQVLYHNGLANDVATFVNRSRRSQGATVSDMIILRLNTGNEVSKAIIWNLRHILATDKAHHIILNETNDELVWERYDCGNKEMLFPVYINVEVDNENNYLQYI